MFSKCANEICIGFRHALFCCVYIITYYRILYPYHRITSLHDDVIKWKHLPRYWPLWGDSNGHRWIPLTKASNAELWCFFPCAHEQTVGVNSRCTPCRSLWRHCNELCALIRENTVYVDKAMGSNVIIHRSRGVYVKIAVYNDMHVYHSTVKPLI